MQGWEWAIGLALASSHQGHWRMAGNLVLGPLDEGRHSGLYGHSSAPSSEGSFQEHRCHGGDYVLAVMIVPTVVRGSPGVSCPALLIPAVDPVWS